MKSFCPIGLESARDISPASALSKEHTQHSPGRRTARLSGRPSKRSYRHPHIRVRAVSAHGSLARSGPYFLEVAMNQSQPVRWDRVAHVVVSAAVVDERLVVDALDRPHFNRTACVVHPDEPSNLELVLAQEDSGHLRHEAPGDARAGRHAFPVQADKPDGLSIAAGGDVKRSHARTVPNAYRSRPTSDKSQGRWARRSEWCNSAV